MITGAITVVRPAAQNVAPGVSLPAGPQGPAGALGATGANGLPGAPGLPGLIQSIGGVSKVAITLADLNLDQVDNTADVDKPVSTAQAQALAAKVGRAEADSAFASDTIVASGATGNVGLSLRKTAVSATLPEVCAQFVIGSNLGNGAEQVFKIGVYGAAQGGPNSGYVLGGNFTGQGYAGAGGYVVTAVEGDVNNNGAAAGAPGSATAAYGFMSVAAGYASSTSAYAATGGNQSWAYGFTVYDYGKPGAMVAAFYDQGSAANVLQVAGSSPRTAIINYLGVPTGFGIIGGNNHIIVGQQDTSGNILTLLKVDGANIGQVGDARMASLNLNAPTTVAGALSSATMRPGSYTVATAPAGIVGAMTYFTNALKPGESAGSGTGVLAVYTNGAWCRTSDYAAIAA